MSTVTHFYHVYAGGEWRDPVSEHIQALYYSEVAQHMKRFYVGYVGTDEQIAEAEQYIQQHIPSVTIARSPSGWEQETMRHIPDYLTDGPVLYAHTKGSSHVNDFTAGWRRSMTKECIINWRYCLTKLEDNDIAGCHWLQAEDGKWFYGGTYWWATTQYLRKLPPVGEENRFMAEHWIGLNPEVKAFDLKPGHPGEIHPSTDWRP